MKRLFVVLYLKLILAAGMAFLLIGLALSQINKQREIHYWQQQLSGLTYLMQQGALRHQGEARMTWLTIAFRITGLPFDVVDITETMATHKWVRVERTSTAGQFLAKFPIEDQMVTVYFGNISKQFMEGVNKLLSNELGLKDEAQHQQTIAEIAQAFNYPVALVDAQSMNLSNFEQRQIQSGLILFRFDQGISAISSFGRQNTLLKTGSVDPFNRYPTAYLVASSAAIFVLTLLFSLTLIRPIERRFSTFSGAVDKIQLDQRNNFSAVNIKQPGHDELAKLSEKVDDMANRIIQFAHEQQQMTRAVSHEIRTPLVKMNYRLARLDSAELSPAQIKNIGGLKKNMAELDQLINELLLYSSLDRLQKPQLKEVNVADFLTEQIQPLNELSDIQIELITDTCCPVILSYPNYLARIVQNLLTNAQRYAQTAIQVQFIQTNNKQQLIVADDGPGIAPALHKKIFEPFVVDDESRNSALNGHGLGLSIVEKMAALLDAEVSVARSERLGGAKFIVAFRENIEAQ